MSARTALYIAIGLGLVHAVLACVYAAITPYRQAGIVLSQGRTPQPDIGAPDERQHANYVQHLLDGKGFPVLGDRGENAGENIEAHQPPLYYLLDAGWAKVFGAKPDDPDGGRPARWLNAVIGGLTVVGTFFIGVWGFRKPELGLLAAVFVALLPMNIALSGAVSNDPLLYALCTWVLALCVKGVRDGWTWKVAVWIGVLTGLSFLTKTTALALLPLLLAAALVPQEKKPSLKMVGVVGAIGVLLAAPWWVRNQKLYGDPLALTAFQNAFTGNPTPDTFIKPLESIGQSPSEATMTYWSEGVLSWTARSFFGVFGYMDIWLNETGHSDTFPSAFARREPQKNLLYRLLIASMFLLFVGWLWATLKGYREERSVQILTAGFTVVVVFLFLRFNMQYFQAQARYLFPAIGAIGVGVAIGIGQLTRRSWVIAFAIVALILAGLNVRVLMRLPDEFALRVTNSLP